MKLKVLLSIAAVYLGLIGIGMIFVPRYFGVGAVPADASSELLAFLRIFGGPCLGIAVLNWLTRNAAPSETRNAVVLANMIGFTSVALSDVFDVSTGGARPAAKLFLVIHLSLAIAFIVAWRGSSARRAA